MKGKQDICHFTSHSICLFLYAIVSPLFLWSKNLEVVLVSQLYTRILEERCCCTCIVYFCRCRFEFCYTCGAEWKNKKRTCRCPIWDERNIIRNVRGRQGWWIKWFIAKHLNLFLSKAAMKPINDLFFLLFCFEGWTCEPLVDLYMLTTFSWWLQTPASPAFVAWFLSI